MTVFLRELAKCFRAAEGREKMLAARWFANILLALCVALLLDFCSCAKVPKKTATELEDLLSEDLNNGFTKGAFVHNTEKLVEDVGDNVEDENGWAEEEEDEDELENEGQDTGDREDGEEKSEEGDEDDNDTEDQYPGDREDGEEESENGDAYNDDDDNDLDEEENGERDKTEGQDEDEGEDVDDSSDETAMEEANELEIDARDKTNENEGKISRLELKSIST